MTSLLSTDLYQLTMVQSYLEHGLTEEASFEFFVRKLPKTRNFLIACGIDTVLETLPALRLTREERQWLEASGRFSSTLIDYLDRFQFAGDIDAVDEGEIIFPNEPILRVTAPLPMAQLVETHVINLLQLPTLIASKAVRMRLAAPDQLLVDFGLRRTHSLAAGLAAARAGFIAGLDGTSNVEAGYRFSIPIFGTMAHSYIQAHASEREAFLHFARSHPDNTVLLIDTYDTICAAHLVVDVADELAKEGIRIKGVRLDSGDLADLARKVRRILDDAGLDQVTIFASGNLDEYELESFSRQSAPIDGYGIGTRMDTSSDAPYLDCAYKLQAYAGEPKWKKSQGKATLPGIKQVFRFSENDMWHHDVISTAGDDSVGGTPLLKPRMRQGQCLHEIPGAAERRNELRQRLEYLPDPLRSIKPTKTAYPVHISNRLESLIQKMSEKS